jgi:hypothetical protein
MFQFPGFALNPYGFRVQYLHLTLRSATPPVKVTSQYKGSKVGFPIRRSLDQSLFAAPQGISQRTTSFIASQRQGIHQMLLRHLIALMIHVRRFRRRHVFQPAPPRQKVCRQSERPVLKLSPEDLFCLPNESGLTALRGPLLEGSLRCCHTGSIPSLRCQTPARRSQRSSTRVSCPRGVLSEPHRRSLRPFRTTPTPPGPMVEPDGIEPTTSCLQSTRSPN